MFPEQASAERPGIFAKVAGPALGLSRRSADKQR